MKKQLLFVQMAVLVAGIFVTTCNAPDQANDELGFECWHFTPVEIIEEALDKKDYDEAVRVMSRMVSEPDSTLVLVVDHATGQATVREDSLKAILSSSEEFWGYYRPVNYTDIRTWSMTMPDNPGGIDWLESNVLYPTLEILETQISDWGKVVVSLPPGSYGFNGLANLGRVVWLNPIDPNAPIEAILRHELGHLGPFWFSHSSASRWDNCGWVNWNPYGGNDVMGKWQAWLHPLSPNKLDQLDRLTTIPIEISEDPVTVIVEPIGTERALTWGAYYFYVTQANDPWPVEDKVVVHKGAFRTKNVSSAEGTVYNGPDNLTVTVGPPANGLCGASAGSYLVTLQISTACQ